MEGIVPALQVVDFNAPIGLHFRLSCESVFGSTYFRPAPRREEESPNLFTPLRPLDSSQTNG